jgi:uncharacterized membrane protein
MTEINGSGGKSLYDRFGVNKERLMSLNDGIFSIAITLLVLDLVIPEIPSQQIDILLAPSLISIYPKMIGYTLSFFIIASYWLSYHRIFSFIREVDRRLVALNIFFLFFIVFMPFPTYLLGLYGPHVSVVLFYAAVITINSIFLYLMWHHAVYREGLFYEKLDNRFIEYLSVRCLIPVCVFLASMVIALASPLAAMISWVSLVLLYPLAKWEYTKDLNNADEQENPKTV